jgi:hypothetical protein
VGVAAPARSPVTYLLEEEERLALQVLGQREDPRRVVVEVTDDDRNLGSTGRLGAPQPAFAEDELVAAVGGWPDEKVELDPMAGDARGQALALGIGEPREARGFQGLGSMASTGSMMLMPGPSRVGTKGWFRSGADAETVCLFPTSWRARRCQREPPGP